MAKHTPTRTHIYIHTYILYIYIYIYKLIYLTNPTEEEIIYAITLFESPVNVDHKIRNGTGKLSALCVRITNDVNRNQIIQVCYQYRQYTWHIYDVKLFYDFKAYTICVSKEVMENVAHTICLMSNGKVPESVRLELWRMCISYLRPNISH